jgi:hypothetical protein
VAGRQSYSARAQNANITLSKAGAQTVAALPEKVYNPYDVGLKIKKVHISLGTAPTGASFVVDVKINGTSVFTNASDRPTITATNFQGSSTTFKTDVDASTVKPGQYVTAEVTQVGSSVAGSDLRVTVLFG